MSGADGEVAMTWGGLDEIFNPGSAHLRDEMKRRRVEAKIPGTEGEPNSVNLEQGHRPHHRAPQAGRSR